MKENSKMKENKCNGNDCFIQVGIDPIEYEKDKNSKCDCQLTICCICKIGMPPVYPLIKNDDKNNNWCISCDMVLFDTKLTVIQLKERWENEKYCQLCFKHKVPIGNSRKGGKEHNDWESRKYHKKCWKEIQEDNEGF